MIVYFLKVTFSFLSLLAMISFLFSSPVASAQTLDHRLELGAQMSGIRFSGLEESGFGGGLRAGWRLRTWLAAEGEFNHLPENPDGNFGQTLIVSGVRMGLPLPTLELAAKLRPGGIHFGGTVFQAFNPQATWKPALDIGAVLLYRPRPRFAVRVDAGALLIFYGSSIIATPLQSPGRVLGTNHNRQLSLGVQVGL